jgi:uncharacterized protein involved in exopolysaccharide biosynthesis
MTIRDFLNVLFKRKAVALWFFAAALVGGYAGLKLVAPTYEATGRLLVRIGSEDMYMPVLPSSQTRMPVMSVVREEQLRSEANILTDGELARRVVADLTPQVLFPGMDLVHPWYTPKGVLQRLNSVYRAIEDYFAPLSSEHTLEDRAVTAFENAIKAEAIKSSNLIEVSMRNKSPEAAALGVNTLLKHYLNERVRIHQREQTTFFTAQLERIEAQIDEAQTQLGRFRSQGRFLDLERQRSAQVDNLNDVRKQIDANRVASGQTERRIHVLRQQLAQVPETTQLAGAEASNSLAASEIGKQLAEVQRREVEITQHYSSNDPRLSVLRDERRMLQRLLDEQMLRRDVSSQQGINPLHARIRDDLLQAEASLAGLRQAAGSLGALERDITGRVGEFNQQDAGYQQLSQRLKVLRDSRQLYTEKAEEARLASEQAAARIGNVAVVSRASAPTRPVSPKLWLVLLGVLAGGVLGGVGLAFLLEFLDDSLRSEADVTRHLRLPLLTQVPNLA